VTPHDNGYETNSMRTKLDLAILPVGNNFTMDVEDAIIAADFVDCDKILGTITTLLLHQN
jgi:L-ascorbate metabolism protein UlaG (beta-lactamase superfamily)